MKDQRKNKKPPLYTIEEQKKSNNDCVPCNKQPKNRRDFISKIGLAALTGAVLSTLVSNASELSIIKDTVLTITVLIPKVKCS